MQEHLDVVDVRSVEHRGCISLELRERIRTEQAAGKVLGDVSHNGSTTTALQLAEGTFQPYGALPNAARPVAPFKADGTRVTVRLTRDTRL